MHVDNTVSPITLGSDVETGNNSSRAHISRPEVETDNSHLGRGWLSTIINSDCATACKISATYAVMTLPIGVAAVVVGCSPITRAIGSKFIEKNYNNANDCTQIRSPEECQDNYEYIEHFTYIAGGRGLFVTPLRCIALEACRGSRNSNYIAAAVLTLLHCSTNMLLVAALESDLTFRENYTRDTEIAPFGKVVFLVGLFILDIIRAVGVPHILHLIDRIIEAHVNDNNPRQ